MEKTSPVSDTDNKQLVILLLFSASISSSQVGPQPHHPANALKNSSTVAAKRITATLVEPAIKCNISCVTKNAVGAWPAPALLRAREHAPQVAALQYLGQNLIQESAIPLPLCE